MNKEYLCVNDKIIYETKGPTPKYVDKSTTLVLNQKCIRNGFVDYSFAQFVSDQQKISSEKYVQIGDVLLNSTGEGTAGRCAFVDYIPKNYKITVDSHMLILRFESIELARFFAYSLFNQEKFILELLTGSSGQGELDREIVYNISFPFIDVNLNIFSKLYASINKKIKLNNNINQDLEKLAKTLYDYWFIQFDFPDKNNQPYKSNGGSMIYNKDLKKEIPVGWNVDNLYRIADYFNGLACQKYRPKENEKFLPVVKIEEMHNGITDETEFVRSNIPDKNKIYAGDILFSWSATLEVMLWTGIDAGLNQHIFKVVPKPSYTKEYVYQQLSAYVNNFVRIAEARKTTMGHITTDHLKQSKIVIPPKELINKYTEKVKDIYKQMILCKQENLSLANLRDFLLPMLMNGQVTVLDSEKDDLSEDKIIEKSLEFWQAHGKMDIDQFAKENGILVYKDNEQKKGAVSYNKEKDSYEIAVKDPRDNFTIAHEIGHILKHKKELKNGTLGRKSEESGSKLMEYEADSLAAEILMPEEYVLQYMQDENKTNKEFLDEKFIKECAKHFDVNPPAMNIRLKKLGFKTPYIR